MNTTAHLTFFGTGSNQNQSRYNSSVGLTLSYPGRQNVQYLFDCGDGILHQTYRYNDYFKFKDVTKVFITHLHMDHVSGLPFMLYSIMYGGHVDNIDVYGPRYLASIVSPMLAHSGIDRYSKIHFHEFLKKDEQLEPLQSEVDFITVDAIYPDEDGCWTCFSDSNGIMRSGFLVHAVDCWGYCFQQIIQNTVCKKIAVFGDTCNSSTMVDMVQNCDVLVHELTCGPTLVDINRNYLDSDVTNWKTMQFTALNNPELKNRWDGRATQMKGYGHSTAEMTGTYATHVNAKNLLLTHIGSKYQADTPAKREKIDYLLVEQVKMYYKGNVLLGYDGMVFEV